MIDVEEGEERRLIDLRLSSPQVKTISQSESLLRVTHFQCPEGVTVADQASHNIPMCLEDSPNLDLPSLGVQKPGRPVDQEKVGGEREDGGPGGHLDGGQGLGGNSVDVDFCPEYRRSCSQ